ncbi:MAG: SPOR domain-containing protein [Gammaproteobacteria bacterium]
MEGNRNLSSIISKIRDEGPPGSSATPQPGDAAGPVHDGDTPMQTAAAATAGPRTSRKLLPGLVLPLVLIIGLLFFAGNYTGYRDDGMPGNVAGTLRGWFAGVPGAAKDAGRADTDAIAAMAVDEQLVRELRARQLAITARLDELTDTISTLSETVNRNWAVNDTVVAGLRQEQQAGIAALEVRVSELQGRLAEAADKPAATEQPAPAKPAAPAKQAVSTKPATVPSQSGTARPAAQAKQATPAKPAARDTTAQAVADEEWVVNVASSSQEQAMLELAAKLKEQGIPVERQTLTIEGDLMYRLRVPGFTTSDEARRYARRLDKEFGLRGPWVSRK